MARCVSIEIIVLRFERAQMVSRMRTRGSSIEATRSRVSSSDLPTLTTTSSHTSSTDRIAGTMGKSIFTALRTRVNADSTSAPELQVIQPAIQPVGGQQMRVTPPLDDPAFSEHDDEVGVLHRCEPVRDHENGAMRHQAFDRFLYQALRFGIECTGRFVENPARRSAQQRARARAPPARPAAESCAPLTDTRGRRLRA